MNIWKPTEIKTDHFYNALIGPLRMWLRGAGDELWIAAERSSNQDSLGKLEPLTPFDGAEPQGLDWGRWVVGEAASVVRLVPVMPDRPVVVRPELPVKIPAEHQAVFFVSIPVWIRITTEEPTRLKLCEHPSVVLSNTWFGDPMSGELCYSLRSRARRHTADSEPMPHRVVCPVRILNAAPEQLDVRHICVHVEHLRVYYGPRQLWTNEIQMTFAKEAEVGQVKYLPKAPDFEPVEQVLGEARTPLKKTLLQRSLGGLSLQSGA